MAAWGPSDKENEPDRGLDPEIVDLLEKEETLKMELSEDIHESVAIRWEMILKAGLKAETISAIIKKHPPIANCRLVQARRLNPESLKAITEQHQKRDERLAGLQDQVGAAMSALGKALTILLNDGGGSIISPLLNC